MKPAMSILAFSVPFLFPLSAASEEVQPARATEIRATEIRTAEIRAALPSRELQAWMADAGVGTDDIDAIYLGYINNGFADQDFPSSLVLQADERFRFKPATRVENA